MHWVYFRSVAIVAIEETIIASTKYVNVKVRCIIALFLCTAELGNSVYSFLEPTGLQCSQCIVEDTEDCPSYLIPRTAPLI